MNYMAMYDSLTDLPKRELFEDRLKQTLYKADRNGNIVIIMYIDLDEFKKVNDTYGHYIGDMVLKSIGKRLKNSFRKSDTIARLSGDEFAAIIPMKDSKKFEENDKNMISIISKRIIDNISKPIEIDNIKCEVGSSIGLSVYPIDCNNYKEILKHADKAMYKAKNKGKNSFIFFRDV